MQKRVMVLFIYASFSHLNARIVWFETLQEREIILQQKREGVVELS